MPLPHGQYFSYLFNWSVQLGICVNGKACSSPAHDRYTQPALQDGAADDTRFAAIQPVSSLRCRLYF
jgi:hypothetical protein